MILKDYNKETFESYTDSGRRSALRLYRRKDNETIFDSKFEYISISSSNSPKTIINRYKSIEHKNIWDSIMQYMNYDIVNEISYDNDREVQVEYQFKNYIWNLYILPLLTGAFILALLLVLGYLLIKCFTGFMSISILIIIALLTLLFCYYVGKGLLENIDV